MNRPEPGQWWLQTDKQDRSDAKYFRVFFCGKDSKNRLIFEDADGNTEVDHGVDWTGWHHEPACTGWDWVPEVFPQWYSYKNGPFESNNDPYLVRVDSAVKQSFVHRSGKVDNVTYPYKPKELVENVRSGAWKKLSQQEADEALYPKKPLSPDVVNDLAVSVCKETKADVVEPKTPLPCSYCSKPEFKGWVLGKCPYCGKVKEDSANVTVYQLVYGDDLNLMNHRFTTSEDAVERCKKRWKYVSVVSTKNVEVML